MQLLSGLLLFALTEAQDQPVVPPADGIRLFNGKDLSELYSWLKDTRSEDPRRVFSVQDGLLRISGDGFGYLSTRKAFRDYRLVVEFKWGARTWRGREGKARDSGIFLHSLGPDGNSFDGAGAFKAAIECQIMQGRVGDLMVIGGKDDQGRPLRVRFSAEVAPERDREGWWTWRKGGEKVVLERRGRVNWFGIDPDWKDVLDFRGRNDVESPKDQWTRVECLCEGDRISIRVNDVTVNEAFAVYPPSGRILLQCEGAEIFFRRLELLPLKNP
jgi:hypothetical protein